MTALPRDFFARHETPAVERLSGLRVALFTGAYNHIADGVALTLNRLVSYLEDRGAEVLVFAPTVSDPPIRHAGTLDPVRSVSAPGRPEYRVARIMTSAQRERLARFGPDLIHIATPDFLGLDALRTARAMDVPVVSSYHTHFTSYLEYYRLGLVEPLLWRYLQAFYARVRHVYVPTPTMAEVLADHGISDGVRLWPRGVETERYHPRHRDMEWRRSLGFGDDDVVVTFVSRLVWEKGLDVFADTIGEMTRRGVAFRSLVVGDGPARDALVERLPDTRFVGYLRGNDLARAYASSELFLFPSETETFGNVTLEAMASGLPAICADAPGSDALVRSGRTGFLVEGRNVDRFAAATAALVRDGDLRGRMGAAAREEAERYAWHVVLDRIGGYYLEAVGRDERTSPADVVRLPVDGLAVPA